MSVRARAFSHAAVRITDVERARAFYEKVLGLKPIERPNFPFGGAWYGLGNNQIHLISSENRGREIDPLGPHIALEVEDFDEARQRLQELGIEFLEGHRQIAGAGRQLWLRDPDGNVIELRANH